jgi:hypothetical protein
MVYAHCLVVGMPRLILAPQGIFFTQYFRDRRDEVTEPAMCWRPAMLLLVIYVGGEFGPVVVQSPVVASASRPAASKIRALNAYSTFAGAAGRGAAQKRIRHLRLLRSIHIGLAVVPGA